MTPEDLVSWSLVDDNLVSLASGLVTVVADGKWFRIAGNLGPVTAENTGVAVGVFYRWDPEAELSRRNGNVRGVLIQTARVYIAEGSQVTLNWTDGCILSSPVEEVVS